MKISIVTTLYNSGQYINEFYDRTTNQLRQLTPDYEIVFVDDGSPDDSLSIAQSLTAIDANVRVIELSRNFGHHKAMMTGLEFADGDLVFLIDADLEEPPELLQQFHDTMMSGGWDVVFGYQEKRKGKWFEREVGRLAWWLVDCLLPIRITHNHSTVRLMTQEYVRALVQHKERNTAIGGLWVLTGFRQKGVPFMKGWKGSSSYNVRRRVHMMFESITSFSEAPLYAIFYLGASILVSSIFAAAYLVVRRAFGDILEGWVSVMVSIWLLGGLAIFSIGVTGLYVARIFIETKNRPYTIIRKTHGQNEHVREPDRRPNSGNLPNSKFPCRNSVNSVHD